MTASEVVLLVLLLLLVVGAGSWAWLRVVLGRVWGPVMDAFPAIEPSTDAECRRFQSFSTGVIKMGWSVHVAADDRHLHLTPAHVFRWLGMGPISVPWDRIELLPDDRFPDLPAFSLGVGPVLVGPAWCLRRTANRA